MPSGRFVYVLLDKQTGKQTGIGTATETQMETEKATAMKATETRNEVVARGSRGKREGERGNGE